MGKEYAYTGRQNNDVTLLVALAIFTVISFTAPPITQPLDYHNFADARSMFGIPRAMDVLTNIGFLVAGAYGLLNLMRLKKRCATPAAPLYYSLALFFAGVVLTAFGSTYYHLSPTSATLVWDRLPMTLAFGGICGALATELVSSRSGWVTLALTTVVGLCSVLMWKETGNLTPYVAVQFGGLIWVAYGWLSPAAEDSSTLQLPWGGVLLCYAIAKAAEHWDSTIFEITLGLISGHSLKHMFAALAAVTVASYLRNNLKKQIEATLHTHALQDTIQ